MFSEWKNRFLGPTFKARDKLTNTDNNTVIKKPLFTIELENTEKARQIYDLKRLLYTVIAVESYRPRAGIKQCFRCQRFNHTFAGCNLEPRCVICADSHSHKDCPIRTEALGDKSKLKCANCGASGHPASYRGCESYKAALNNFNQSRQPNSNSNKTKTTGTTQGNTFNSRKVSHGLSYSSAVTSDLPTVPKVPTYTPAQSRLQVTAASQRRPQSSSNLASVGQLVNQITPLLTGLDSYMDRFMLLWKLVEICIGPHV